MIKTFPIDYLRQIFAQALFEEKVKNKNLIGGDSEVALFSFYEQLSGQEEVDRYVENYRQLLDQENRMDLIANGTIIAPENPSITNINQATIIPLSFTCAFRTTLANRDLLVETISNLIQRFKGRKVDVAELDNGKLFMVGTMANQVNGVPTLKNGDYLGDFNNANTDLDTYVSGRLTALGTLGITIPTNVQQLYFYVEEKYANGDNKIIAVAYNTTTSKWTDITYDRDLGNIIPYPAQHNNFTKYQVSISFDSQRCDEPRILNSEETCYVSFSGSATIVNESVLMGNQLTKLSVQKYKILADTDIDLSSSSKYWLEPLEMPSGNNANSEIINKISNKFIAKTHTDSLANTIQYSFILDTNITLLKQWFKYGRYGIQGTSTQTYADGVSPNMIYKIQEIWSCWGVVDFYTYYAKLVESIDIENTESDVLSLTLTFQNQQIGE